MQTKVTDYGEKPQKESFRHNLKTLGAYLRYSGQESNTSFVDSPRSTKSMK